MSQDDRPYGQPRPTRGARTFAAAVDPRYAAVVAATVSVLAWKLSDLDARALWFDEAFSWQLTQFPLGEMFARAGDDVHPPLYYVVLRLWIGIAGDSVYAMRLLSVFWFAAALAGGYRLAGLAGGPAGPGRNDAGWLAVLLLVSSSFLLRYAQEVRMYAQLLALLMWSSWLLLRALGGGGGSYRWWPAYTLAAAAMAYTHYLGIFSLVAQAAFCCGLLLWRAGRRLTPLARDGTFWAAAASGLAVVVLYLPWIPRLLVQRARVSKDYWVPSVAQSPPISLDLWRVLLERCALHNKTPLLASYPVSDRFEYYLGYALLAGVLAVLVILARRPQAVAWYVIAAVLVPVVLSIANSYRIGRNLIEHRYLICPFAMLLIGLAIALSRLRRRALRWCVAGWVSVNMLYCAVQFQTDLRLETRPESRGAVRYLLARYRESDAVICLDPVRFHTLKYYARGRLPIRQLLPRDAVIKHYSGGPIFRKEDFLTASELGHYEGRRVWTVGPANQAPAAPPWHEVSSRPFLETIPWFGTIWVTLWSDRGGPEPGADRLTPPDGPRDRPEPGADRRRDEPDRGVAHPEVDDPARRASGRAETSADTTGSSRGPRAAGRRRP